MEDRGVTRVYFIDWLRILAVLLLFPRHTLRLFDEADPFYVQASPVSVWVGQVIRFISVWHMPLLFFLAGCSTYYALRKRSGGRYAWERVKRLLVPLVFGILILIPPQTWYGGRFNSGYTGSYWHYLVSGDFMRMNIQDNVDFFGGFGVGQLWFIYFLLFISLVALPLLVWGARGRGIRRMQAFSRRLAKPAWWFLPVVILLVGNLTPDAGGYNFVFSLFLFLLGFIAVCDPTFMESAERYRIPSLAVGVGLTLFWVLNTDFRESFPDRSWQLVGLRFGGVIATWLMLMSMLGFGQRYLDRTSRVQKYLAEGSYPLYILHQTVIVIIGFYVIRLAAPRPVLWVLLLVAAVAATFALYEIVRRVGVLRFLFGMRQRRKATCVEPVSARAAAEQVDA
jgi:glucans biosynthesis protein C